MIGFDKDNMNNDIDHVLVSEEQLRERIALRNTRTRTPYWYASSGARYISSQT